jgi:trans-2,3-dihydro-3-hydroxyanthranilate isomerase
MVFAGHPTIGTAFVLLEEGIVPGQREHFVLEERIGRVPIRVEWSEAERPLIWLRTPPIEYGRVYDRGILYVHVMGRNGADGIEVGGYVTPVAKRS